MQMHRSKKIVFPMIVLGVVVFAFRWFFSSVETVIKPQRGRAVKAVYATGTVESSVMVPLAPRNSARLVALHFDEGSKVPGGALLAELESTDLLGSLKEEQSRAVFAKREYERNVELAKKQLISPQDLEKSRSEAEASAAAVARVQSLIDQMNLRSPAECHVIRRDGEVGELIPANQPVFWLDCSSVLRISADVDEEDIPLVKQNQIVLIRADAFPGQIFKSTVESITPKGDPSGRSFRVRIGLDSKTPLRIGMTVETNIIVEERENALLVPSGTIREDRVYLLKSGQAVAQEVKVGARGIDQTEILSGISDQDLVLLDAARASQLKGHIRSNLTEWTLK